MELLKMFLIFLMCFTFGFGAWYLIIWFLTTEQNLFLWPWYVKLIYLILGFSSTSSTVEQVIK